MKNSKRILNTCLIFLVLLLFFILFRKYLREGAVPTGPPIMGSIPSIPYKPYIKLNNNDMIRMQGRLSNEDSGYDVVIPTCYKENTGKCARGSCYCKAPYIKSNKNCSDKYSYQCVPNVRECTDSNKQFIRRGRTEKRDCEWLSTQPLTRKAKWCNGYTTKNTGIGRKRTKINDLCSCVCKGFV